MSTFTVTIYVGRQPDVGVTAARRKAVRRTIRASVARDINWMWRKIDPADEKSPIYREQVPGLTLLADIGGEFRGGWWTGSRLFMVFGTKLYELDSEYTATELGTLDTSSGPVDFAQGLFQLVMVDGVSGYVLTLGSGAFTKITDPDFYPSERVSFLDGRFQFTRKGTQQFFWSDGIDNATEFDSLGFASAESAPDNIVSHLVDHRELWLFGEYTTEVWYSNPVDQQPYQRNNGASIEVGCIAPHSPMRFDNSIVWIGSDKAGHGVVYKAGGGSGYQPVRISTHNVEEALQKSADLSLARCFVHQDDGQTFYAIYLPDLETTWLYDASVNRWHERCEMVGGKMLPWRAIGHVFAFGKHIVGDSDGKLYELDPYEYTYDGDPIYRETTSPHNVVPSIKRQFFGRLILNVTTGLTSSGNDPKIEMRYSDDGGETWSRWTARSLGKIGEYNKMPRWDRNGMARDRVWQFRCSDDCKASIVGIDVETKEGTS